MSVTGYLGKGNSQLRMPKGQVDALGAEYEGDVLCGKASVEERRAADAREAQACLKKGERDYESVEEYDPVLRWHCRL